MTVGHYLKRCFLVAHYYTVLCLAEFGVGVPIVVITVDHDALDRLVNYDFYYMQRDAGILGENLDSVAKSFGLSKGHLLLLSAP